MLLTSNPCFLFTDLGGIWRLKWKHVAGDLSSASSADYVSFLGAACMHGGSRIYGINCRCGDNSQPRESIVSTQQDESNPDRLVYGLDWLNLDREGGGDENGNINWKIVTCSFYDNTIQIWTNR